MALLLPKLFPCGHAGNWKSPSQSRWIIDKTYPKRLPFTSDQKLAEDIGGSSDKVYGDDDQEAENGEKLHRKKI